MQQSIRHSYVIILYPQPWQKITAKDQTTSIKYIFLKITKQKIFVPPKARKYLTTI